MQIPPTCNSTEGSRSTCRRCLKPLTVGSLRLGVRSHIPLFNHTIATQRIPLSKPTTLFVPMFC